MQQPAQHAQSLQLLQQAAQHAQQSVQQPVLAVPPQLDPPHLSDAPPPKPKRKPSSKPPRSSRIMNCNNCRTKKMRCDRKVPCSNCATRSVPCEWEVGPPPPDTHPEVLRQNGHTITQLRKEVASLSARLNLSPDELDSITAEADALVLAAKVANQASSPHASTLSLPFPSLHLHDPLPTDQEDQLADEDHPPASAQSHYDLPVPQHDDLPVPALHFPVNGNAADPSMSLPLMRNFFEEHAAGHATGV